jgi:hypothetical protein
VNVDVAKTVEVALNGMRRLSPSHLAWGVVILVTLSAPFWIYRFADLAVDEMQSQRQDVIRVTESAREHLRELQRTQHETAREQLRLPSADQPIEGRSPAALESRPAEPATTTP